MSISKLKPLRKAPPNDLLQYLPRWQSNNSPKDLGVKNFIFDLVQINDQMGYPPLLRDFKPEWGIAPWAAKSLSQYFCWEEGMSKEDRCFLILTYREGSKTSWFSYFLPLYEMLVGQYGIYYQNYLFPEIDYQILRGKNSKEAQKKIMFINNFLNKPIIKRLFGNLKPSFKEVREAEGKVTGTLMIFNNGYIFECSGIDQPSRGLNLLGVRPKKFTFDDIQNRENTKTPDRRKSIDTEVMEESFPAIADEGSLVYICNRVHPADTAGRLIDPKNTTWKKSIYTFTMRRRKDGKIVPGVGDLKNEEPEWPSRWNLEQAKKRLDWFSSQPNMGGITGALKNYYNIIKADANYKIKYYKATYQRLHDINWLVFQDENGQNRYVNVSIFIGLDPAISEAKSACNAAITVLAVDSDRNRYILQQKFGKWDIRDRFVDDSKAPARGFALTVDELANVKRIGSASEIARLAFRYHADGVDVEARVGQQMTFYNEAKEALEVKLGWKGVLRPEPAPPEGKVEKLKQTPLIYFESGLYYLPGEIVDGEWQPREDVEELKNDVVAFPDCEKDRLDSIYLAEQIVSYPIKIEFNPLGQYGKSNFDELNSSKNDDYTNKLGSLLNDHESWIAL